MLKDKLFDDLKIAMKEKDVIRKNTIQLVRNAILNFEKDNKVELDDEAIISIFSKELKKRNDSIPEFEKSGREDLINELKAEINILMEYLPKQLTDEELEIIVEESIKESGATSISEIGKIMAVIMPKTKGKADNKRVNEIIRKKLV